ncbi:uncharacterized protein LOC129572786 [Sitodiplosis mosellana]|uniref:uncharacterized protein LOC129572786 n=1 Tax=Sitodiplosis mosellana TaxID=263140 RepID=UPI0024443594|nr:uncharacterized protein LOC129572786 [Sitodiplosis mosellana]
MVTNPQFKLNFLGFREVPSHISQRVRNMLLAAGKVIQQEQQEKQKRAEAAEAAENLNQSSSNNNDIATASTSATNGSSRSRANPNQNPDTTDSLLIEHDVSDTMGASLDFDTTLMMEINSYLCSKTENIENGLQKYPILRRIFLKYNCIRSTEAICERLFSYAGFWCFLFGVWCLDSYRKMEMKINQTLSLLVRTPVVICQHFNSTQCQA